MRKTEKKSMLTIKGDFIEIIAEIQKKLGLNDYSMAETIEKDSNGEIKISRRTISYWHKGHMPSSVNIRKLEKWLAIRDLSIADFCNYPNPSTEVAILASLQTLSVEDLVQVGLRSLELLNSFYQPEFIKLNSQDLVKISEIVLRTLKIAEISDEQLAKISGVDIQVLRTLINLKVDGLKVSSEQLERLIPYLFQENLQKYNCNLSSFLQICRHV